MRDLIVSKQLSMHPDRYAHDVFQAFAAKQLIKKGIEISAGQTVRYLITDAEIKGKLVEYLWFLKKRGYTKSTVNTKVKTLKRLLHAGRQLA